MITKICFKCGKKFQTQPCWVKKGGGKFCSHRCKGAHFSGDKSPCWKGGYRKKNGYILIRLPSHPNADHGYVSEHRLTMEKYLGRFLKTHEQVHHINNNRSDNRIENLQIVTLGEHNHIHNRIGKMMTKNPLFF